MRTKIYVLCNPDGTIRYVGKTVKRLGRRLSAHLSNARRGCQTHTSRWIRLLFQKGLLPQIQLLGEAEGCGSKEEIAWIAYFKARGIPLTNRTDGGERPTGYTASAETRKKISAKLKGKPHSKEHRRKLSEARRRRSPPSKETCEKIRNSLQGNVPWNTGKHHSEETKRKISQRGKGRKLSAEARHNISEGHKGTTHSQETRKKMSESRKRYFANKKRWDAA